MKIVAMGDSLTAVQTVSPNIPDAAAAIPYCWVTLLNNIAGDTYINKGIGGQITSEMLARFDTDVIANKPDICIILSGVNDLFQKKTIDLIVNNINAMIIKCKTNNIIPIIATPIPEWNFDWRFTEGFDKGNYSNEQYDFYPESSGKLSALRNRLTQYCIGNNINIIDLYNTEFLSSPTSQDLTCYLSDKIHPNEKGYRIMAKTIFASVNFVKQQANRLNKLSALRNALNKELSRRGISNNTNYSSDNIVNKPIKALHIQELMNKLTTIKNINFSDNSPVQVQAVIKDIHETQINTMINVLQAHPKEGGVSDCNSSCTGLCVSCSGSCTGGCTNCTGCSGCGNACSNNCNNGCYTNCAGQGCKIYCNVGCKGGCISGCANTCYVDCATDCGSGCVTDCSAANFGIIW